MVYRATFSIPPLLVALLVGSIAGMSSHAPGHPCARFWIRRGLHGANSVCRLPGLRTRVIGGSCVDHPTVDSTTVAIVALFLGAELVTIVGSYAVGSLSAAALGTWMMYRRIARPRLRFDLRGALRVTREAFPIGMTLIALTVLFRIDMSMLAIFKPASQVGNYAAAYKLLETTAFFSWAVNVAVLPSLSRLSPTTIPPVGALYQRGLKLVIAITLPVAVGAIILAGPIISLLYGSQYHAAALALALLAPTIALFPISALSSQLFFAQGSRPTVAIVYAIVVVENVALNLVLIPVSRSTARP